MTDELEETEREVSAAALLATLHVLIQDARKRALRAVDVVQVQTCWEIGRHILEFEQGGAPRAEYGARLLPTLARSLTAEFGPKLDGYPMHDDAQGIPACRLPNYVGSSSHLVKEPCGSADLFWTTR